MNILEKIRTKAQQAVQGIGNFIDRDKSMSGVQLAKGGLINRVANTQVGGHRLADQVKAYPEAFSQNLPFTPERQENFNRNVGDIFGEKSIPTTLSQGFNNWVGAPLAQVPYNLKETFAPGKTKMERVGSAAQAGFGLLPGVDDAIIATLNSAKTAAAKRNVSGFQEGLAGNEYTGLGDAVTGGKEGLTTDLLNVAELPLLVFGGLKAGGIKSVDDSLQNLKNVDGKATAQAVGNVADDVGKQADTIVKEVVEKTQPNLEQLFKSRSKAAKTGREALKSEVAGTTFNPGNRVTSKLRDMFFDTTDDLKRTFGKIYDTQISPVINKHTERIAQSVDWKNKYRSALENIDIVPGSKEDALIRQFGEKNGAQTVISAVGEERAAQLKQTYDALRGMYDEILDTVNAARKSKGLNEIPKKENFLSQIGSKEKGIFDFTLEGGVDTTDPASKAIFKKQTGKNKDLGAVESMTQYLEYAARAGFTDLTGAELGMLKKVLKKAGAPEDALAKLTRLEGNILGTTGKGNLEKTIESVTGQMRQAAVVGKVGTLVNQFLSAPQGFIAAGLKNSAVGQFSKEARRAAESSQFLKATSDKIPRSLRTGNAYTKAVGITGDMLQGAQQTTNKAIWQSFYQQAKNMGQTAEEAVAFADQITPKLVGDRRLGMSPAAYNTLLGKIFGAFTLEPTAASTRLMSQAMKMTKDKKAASEVIGTVIGWHFINGLYERWGAGYRPYPDIPEAVLDSIGYATGTDEKEQSGLKAVARIFSEALQFTPAINNVFNTIYATGEMAQIFPDSREVFGQDDNTWMNAGSMYNPLGNATRRITGAPLVDVPINVASNFLPFVDQAAKTTQAGVTLAKGAAESRGGGVTFAAPDNPIDAARSLLFGQYSTPEAQEFYDNDFNRPLSDKETAAFWNLPREARRDFLETKQTSEQNKNRLKSGAKTSSIMDIFGGGKKEPGYSGITPTTKEEKQAVADYVNTSLEGGAIPDARDIKNGLFNGYTAKSESIEERTKVYTELNKIMNDEYLTDEQKEAVIKASGADAKEAEYFNLAAKDQDVRLQEMLPILDNMDNKQMIEYLSQGRRAVGGKQLVSNGMIDYLYEMDYISDAEKDALKAIKYDEIGNKFYLSKSYKGKGSISYKEALKLFKVDLPKFSTMKSVESLLSNYGGGMQQTGSQGETLLSDVLYNAPNRKNNRNSKLWF